MVSNEKKSIFDSVVFAIKPGETVLVEHTSVSSPELFLYLLLWRCIEKGIPVIVDDIADTFHEYVTRLSLMGLPVEGLSKVPVIKIGGEKKVGNILGNVEVRRYSLDFKSYREVYEKVVPEEPVCNPVIGLHKLFVALDIQDVRGLVRNITNFVGDKSRFALYIINKDSLVRVVPEILALLEEVSSSVLQWEVEKNIYKLRVIKASNIHILGSELSLPIKDIFGI